MSFLNDCEKDLQFFSDTAIIISVQFSFRQMVSPALWWKFFGLKKAFGERKVSSLGTMRLLPEEKTLEKIIFFENYQVFDVSSQGKAVFKSLAHPFGIFQHCNLTNFWHAQEILLLNLEWGPDLGRSRLVFFVRPRNVREWSKFQQNLEFVHAASRARFLSRRPSVRCLLRSNYLCL